MTDSFLNTQEYDEFLKLSQSLNLDESTKKQAIEIFVEYKKKSYYTQPKLEKTSLLLKCSVLIASKSQIIKTINGESVRGIGLSVTHLLKESTKDIDEFIFTLKEFVGVVPVDYLIESEIKAMVNNFSFIFTFFKKYEQMFKKMDWTEKNGDVQDYLISLKQIGWLLFIGAKGKIIISKTEIIDCTCLLVSLLFLLITNSCEYVRPNLFKHVWEAYDVKSADYYEHTLKGLYDLFHIKDVDLFRSIHADFLDYINLLISNEVMKSAKPNDLFNPLSLTQNYKKLEFLYQKNLKLDEIDERFFIQEKSHNYTPSKFTPFSRQGNANSKAFYLNAKGINFGVFPEMKNSGLSTSSSSQNTSLSSSTVMNSGSSQQAKPMSSQRLLNYEYTDNITMKSTFSEIKFPKQVPVSPYTIKGMPTATPMTAAMEMYNWLYDYLNKSKEKKTGKLLSSPLEKYLSMIEPSSRTTIFTMADKLIEKVVNVEKSDAGQAAAAGSSGAIPSTYDKKQRDNRKQLITSLYHKVLEELLIQEEKKGSLNEGNQILYSEAFHKGLIVCCCESVFFVLNVSNVPFTTILEITESQPYEIWHVISTFLRFDPNMPLPLKFHILDLEVKIVCQLAWRKDSILHQIVKNYLAEYENSNNMGNKQGAIEIESEGANQEQLDKENSNTINILSRMSISGKYDIKNRSMWEEELFFKRVLYQIAYQIYQLTSALNLSEKVSENVWSTMKYVLGVETELLINRHLDQLILCSIYSNCKIMMPQQNPIRFQDIISKYQEQNPNNKPLFHEIIYNVYIDSQRKGDIILFYNTVFITPMRSFIYSQSIKKPIAQTRPASPSLQNPIIPNLPLQSPLKAMIPAGISLTNASSSKKTPVYTSYGKNPMTPSLMTPKTQMLYAFAESPFLNSGELSRRPSGNLNSKKVLNFEQVDNNKENSDYNRKKMPSSTKYSMEKIIETNQENMQDTINNKIASTKIKANLPVPIKMPETSGSPSQSTPKLAGAQAGPSFLKNFAIQQNLNTVPDSKPMGAKFMKINFDQVEGAGAGPTNTSAVPNKGSNTPEFRLKNL